MPHQPTRQQLSAIEADLGPVLVLAGPGAGKTFCLIERIRHLVETVGLSPERICAVTFTNKAAEEIAVRLKGALGQRSEEVTRGTLHSLCLGVLREFPELAGLRKGFGVADDAYQQLVLRRLDVWPVKRRGPLLLLFGRRRRQGYPLSSEDEKLFVSYRAFLRDRNMVDFDDIIALTRDLLAEDEEVARIVAGRWDYLLVDEFQDLSQNQYDILRILAEQHGNLFGVGDDEQSIFSWTGADSAIIATFQRDFSIEQPVILEENRRCSDRIFPVARRLLSANPNLFDKQLRASRKGDHPVEAHAFPSEIEEGNWIVSDIQADRILHKLQWGDFAVLYRRHRTGNDLERALLRAGIPCRLARGKALLDDRVVAYVIGSLRLMVSHGDAVTMEAFAASMLPDDLMEAIRAEAQQPVDDFVAALRDFAGRRRGDPDARKVWRLVYHIENMKAMFQSHSTLAGLVEDLLTGMRGPVQNRLEDRHEELTDPAAFPGAPELARRIEQAAESGGVVWLAPAGGAEIGMVGMFVASGVPVVCRYLRADSEPAQHDLVLGKGQPELGSWATLIFKALQLIAARGYDRGLTDFVAFDLETTDKDVAECEVVEIAAVRVRGGEVVDSYRSLVRPEREISARATEVHGYRATDLEDAPPFTAVWPGFKAFVGDDVLLAHNGQLFDVPVLRRMVGGVDPMGDMVFFDTLPLARSLMQGSARLEDLADAFGIAKGRAHHADDDAATLALVVKALNARKLQRSRKCALANALDFLGLALALTEKEKRQSSDDRLLFELGHINALGSFSDCLEFYELHRGALPDAPGIDRVVALLGGENLRVQLRNRRTPAERFPASVARIRSLVEASERETVAEGVSSMLERAALSTSEGVEAEPHRVNLLTLHSTKGLEFSRVYVVGVEDAEIPGWREIKENNTAAIEEARRLLYVGMTRAIDRLVLTRADERFGGFGGGSMFLNEMGLKITEEAAP